MFSSHIILRVKTDGLGWCKQVAEEIFSSAECFYEKTMRDPNTWFKHMSAEAKASFDWSRDPAKAKIARDHSLLHKHKPVVSYDDDELDEPMHNGTISIWEMCAGMLGQVFFTLPLKKNSFGQYVPTTLMSDSSSSYNPFEGSSTPNVSALEDFMLEISRSVCLLFVL